MTAPTPDARELYDRAARAFGERVHAVRDDQWGAPTPCSDWDVRMLVNHLVGENRWAPPLFAGATIAEVGDRYDGDLLGPDPVSTWDESAAAAAAAVHDPAALDRSVHLSFGDCPGREYAMQLFADLLVHGWDLSRAIGAHDRMDPELVDACAAWFATVAEAYRAGGAVAPRVPTPPDADPQTVLLADFGRAAAG
jgi:uncharacterized protein (TIGR03086 family)